MQRYTSVSATATAIVEVFEGSVEGVGGPLRRWVEDIFAASFDRPSTSFSERDGEVGAELVANLSKQNGAYYRQK